MTNIYEIKILPSAQHIVYKKSTHSNNNLVRDMSSDSVNVVVGAMSLQRDDKLKVALIRIRFSFLPHVVEGRFTKVQTTHGHFVHFFDQEVDSAGKVYCVHSFAICHRNVD